MPHLVRGLAAGGFAALVLAACGSASHTALTTSQISSASAPPPAGLASAQHPRSSQFPQADGRSLAALARGARGIVRLGAATGTFTPGVRRFAFALIAKSGSDVYAPTALYIASSPRSRAQGPFLAPDDSLIVAPQYRSKQNEGPGDIAGIYHTELPLPRSGIYDVLALTREGSKLVGSTGEIAVATSSPIPNVGQRPPDIATDTLASVHGRIALLTTRLPPEDMHAVSFSSVLGKRPVALLFSTPQLCTSRVCGPVTDEFVSLQHEYEGRIAMIHEEVYVDNNVSKGLRPQLKAFHLETEPWLFTVNRQGVIVARLEGAFGLDELRAALNAALK